MLASNCAAYGCLTNGSKIWINFRNLRVLQLKPFVYSKSWWKGGWWGWIFLFLRTVDKCLFVSTWNTHSANLTNEIVIVASRPKPSSKVAPLPHPHHHPGRRLDRCKMNQRQTETQGCLCNFPSGRNPDEMWRCSARLDSRRRPNRKGEQPSLKNRDYYCGCPWNGGGGRSGCTFGCKPLPKQAPRQSHPVYCGKEEGNKTDIVAKFKATLEATIFIYYVLGKVNKRGVESFRWELLFSADLCFGGKLW